MSLRTTAIAVNVALSCVSVAVACSSSSREFGGDPAANAGGNFAASGSAGSGQTDTAGKANAGGGGSAQAGSAGSAGIGGEPAGAGGEAGASGALGTGGAKPAECAADERRCQDKIPELCADGEWSQAQGACAMDCIDGACTECVPGSKDCSGKVPRICNENGEWVSGTACAKECQDGACVTDCTTSATRCNGKAFETCNNEGTWANGTQCQYVCDPSAGCIGQCNPDQVQCSGNTPQTCNDKGVFQSAPACSGSLPICKSGKCVACNNGERRCSGATIQVCNADGEWVNQSTCSGNTPVCDAKTVECVCSATQANRCANSSTLLTCSNGSWTESACSAATPFCMSGACKECSTGMRCKLNELSSCEAGTWKPTLTCELSCQDGRCRSKEEIAKIVRPWTSGSETSSLAAGAEEWWVLDTDESGSYEVHTAGGKGQSPDTVLWVYKSVSTGLQFIGHNDDCNGGSTSCVPVNFTPGRYYFKVMSSNGSKIDLYGIQIR